MIKSQFFLYWKFSLVAIHQCHNIYYIVPGSLFFSGMGLLNWLKRSARSVVGFRIRELFEFFDSLLLLLLLLLLLSLLLFLQLLLLLFKFLIVEITKWKEHCGTRHPLPQSNLKKISLTPPNFVENFYLIWFANVNQVKLIYAMSWIVHNGWFKQ